MAKSKPVPISWRLWLFTWWENKCESYSTFEQAYHQALSSGEAWCIVRLPDFVEIARSTMSIRKPADA